MYQEFGLKIDRILQPNSHRIYAAATLLNPTKRIHHFHKNWTGQQASWLPMMNDTCYRWWNDNYLHLKRREDAAAKKLNSFELHLLGRHDSEGVIKQDDFRGYAKGCCAQQTSVHEGFCEDLARQNTVAHLSQLQLGSRRCRILVLCCRIGVSVIAVVS